MRVRTTVKRAPARAAALARWLRSLEGVERVEVSPLTGSALIHYRVGAVDANRLMAEMQDGRWITAPAAQPAKASRLELNSLEGAAARAVLRGVVEFAIERSVLALLAALV